jgi:hypothetical protein
MIRHGYGRLRAYAYYLYRLTFKRAERGVGMFLRKIGLKRITDLYRRLFYRHVPGDF